MLNKYFTEKELSCRCGCGKMPSEFAIEKLFTLRKSIGIPLIINSGARCALHNKNVGGSVNSMHVVGIAFDIRFPNTDLITFLKYSDVYGFYGIGIDFRKRFVHVDLRVVRAMWGY